MASKTCVSSIRKKETARKSRKHVPKVNTSQARSNIEVLRMCLHDLGWKECITSSSTNSDIYWNSATFQEGNRNYGSTSARVNKFPGMCDLLYKSNLTRSLNVMRTLFPDEFNFYPKTWFLPEQREQFQDDARTIHRKDRRRQRSLTTFIVKPSDGSEGAGIYLIQDPSRCGTFNRPYIVQEYIDSPLLINDLKFDIRIYVLILDLDPLQILLYDEGLARFATVEYQAPSIKNLHETFMHLTNYSLNKRSNNYKHATDEKQIDASKRKLSLVWSQLSHLFRPSEIERAKQMIEEMINKTVLAILPELRVQYAMELPMTRKQNRCFQIIGFDIILTDKLKPMLLEVNANPSLRIDFDHVNETGKLIHEPSLIDEEIKKPLVLETLKIVMKYKQHRNQLVVDMKNETETSCDPQLSSSDSSTSNSILEEYLDDEQQNQMSSREEVEDSNKNTSSETLINSDLINNNSTSSTQHESMIITIKRNIIQSSKTKKSLQIIFPITTSSNKYDHMFLLEKIAFIYIELVIKRGHKAMNNWLFRNLAKICGIVDQSTTMSSIDILYIQIFQKCKQFGSQSPATGLCFPAFIEAFFLLSRHKYLMYGTLLDSVTELVNSCNRHLDLSLE